jgi:shikimate dehydrogenase
MTANIPHAYVIGNPVKHSRSPQIHRYWLKHYHLDGCYDLAELAPEQLKAFIEKLRRNDNAGANVTLPYKRDVMPYLDQIDEDACNVGAVNTIYKQDGKLLGTNTDVYGFLTHLSLSAPDWRDTTQNVMIIGAGGAARAILSAMKKTNIDNVYIANRTKLRAQNLAKDIHPAAQAVEMSGLHNKLANIDLLINTTSLGMTGQPPLELNLSALPKHSIVVDIVYSPLKTDLLYQAEKCGLVAVDGLGMLLHQAVRGFELWFGTRPEVTPELRRLVEKSLEAGS